MPGLKKIFDEFRKNGPGLRGYAFGAATGLVLGSNIGLYIGDPNHEVAKNWVAQLPMASQTVAEQFVRQLSKKPDVETQAILTEKFAAVLRDTHSVTCDIKSPIGPIVCQYAGNEDTTKLLREVLTQTLG